MECEFVQCKTRLFGQQCTDKFTKGAFTGKTGESEGKSNFIHCRMKLVNFGLPLRRLKFRVTGGDSTFESLPI